MPYGDGFRGVSHEAVFFHRYVQLHQVSITQDAATGNAVHGLIVHADATRSREAVDDLWRRAGTVLPHHARANLIEFGGRHPRPNVLPHGLHHPPDDTDCRAEALAFFRRI